jgi:hypothetical protein
MRRLIKTNFTLVELLAVLAVIMILFSLLMPALKNAHTSSCRITCISNMKQISLGLSGYCSDFNDYYPKADTQYWAYVVCQQLNLSPGDSWRFKIPAGFFNIMICPATTSLDSSVKYTGPIPADEKYWASSYTVTCQYSSAYWNYPVTNPQPGFTDAYGNHVPEKKVSRVTEGSVILIDADYAGLDTDTGAQVAYPYQSMWPDTASGSRYGSSQAGISWRHQRTTNFLFKDGHSQGQKLELGLPVNNNWQIK